MMRGSGRKPVPLVPSGGDDSDGEWEGGKWEGDDDEAGILLW